MGFAGMELVNYRTKQEQISGHIRERIGSGELPEGSRLPAASKLAQDWSIPVATVHRALAALVKEGLVTRRPNVGTVVTARSSRLETVALLTSSDLAKPDSDYARCLNGLLAREFARRGVKTRPVARDDVMEDLRRLAANREIQGVAAVSVSGQQLEIIRGLPVPFVFAGDAKTPELRPPGEQRPPRPLPGGLAPPRGGQGRRLGACRAVAKAGRWRPGDVPERAGAPPFPSPGRRDGRPQEVAGRRH